MNKITLGYYNSSVLNFKKQQNNFFVTVTSSDIFSQLNKDDWYCLLNKKIREVNKVSKERSSKLMQILDPCDLLNKMPTNFRDIPLEKVTLEDFQKYFERIIVEEKKVLLQEGKRSVFESAFLNTLLDKFPLQVANWLYNLIIEQVFYQNSKKTLEYYTLKCTLYLAPVIQTIYTNLENNVQGLLGIYKEYTTKNILQRLEILKSMLLKETDAELKTSLVKEKNCLRDKKRRLVGKESIRYVRELILDVLLTFQEEGFDLEKLDVYTPGIKGKKTYYVIYITETDWFCILQQYARLGKKPMVCKPNPWLWKDGDLQSGGYLLFKETNLNIFHNSSVEMKVKSVYSKEYARRINILQNQAYVIQDNIWIRYMIDVWLSFFFKKLKKARTEFTSILGNSKKNLEELTGTDSRIASIRLQDFEKEVNKLNVFVIQAYHLKTLELAFKKKKLPFKIYCPIHIDKIGRMYQYGLLNIVNSKFFRCILQSTLEKDDNKNFDILKEWKQPKSITLNIGKNFPRLKYLEYVKDKKTRRKLVFMDATSSMLQIVAFLFGYEKIAEYTNLGGLTQQDCITWIAKKWVEDAEFEREAFCTEIKRNLDNRKTMKTIIMLLIYGSSVWGLLRVLKKKELESDTKISAYWKDAIIWIAEKIKGYFPDLFLLTKTDEGCELTKIIVKWQGNETEYSMHKTTRGSFDITDIMCSQLRITREDLYVFVKKEEKLKYKKYQKRYTLSFQTPSDKLDTARIKRTILTSLIQSIDAAVAVELRIRMYERYNISVYSIHDCFGCDSCYGKQLLQTYKECLIDLVFTKKLSEFITIYQRDKKTKSNVTEVSIISKMEEVISKRKDTISWKRILQATSEHCLLLE